ncbi:MAG: hypothetical protein E7161_04395 [Firmicutes bacterium]|nr:hypothetical protein [Bacillota bacterium]
MREEIWKDIKNYEGFYQISNYGRVKSVERIRKGKTNQIYLQKERILKQHLNKKTGYYQVYLTKNSVPKLFLCHRLVAKAFIKNSNNKVFVNHIDGNKKNNIADNLEWCTHSENIQHAYNNNLISRTKNRFYYSRHKKDIKLIEKEVL